MGKSNRIRVNRADNVMTSAIKPKKKQGMPLWLQTTILIVAAVLVLSVCVVSILSAHGVFKRYSYPLRSENYKISATMFSFYYQKQVSEFNQNYANYTNYLGLDTTKDLAEQPFSETAKQILGTSFSGETWQDYFVDLTKNHATQVLRLCEVAKEKNLELDDADLTEMNNELLTLRSAAEMYGYTVDQMIAMQYGEGIKLKDFEKAQELNALANKALYTMQEELADAITDDEIQTRYDAEPDSFDFVDYLCYTENISYTAVAQEILGSNYTEADLKAKSDEVLEAYAEKIAAAKKFVEEELLTATTPEEFKDKYLTKIANDQYKTKYDAMTVAEDKLPDEETINAIRDKILADAIQEIKDGKDAVSEPIKQDGDTYKVGDYTVSKEFADFVKTTKVTVFNALLEKDAQFDVENGRYTADSDMHEWLFAKREANDIDKFYTGDGADGEVTDENGSFTASAAIVVTPRFRDDVLSKNFAYMVFTSEADAKAAIEEFAKGEISHEAFWALADSYPTATIDNYADYTKGAFGLDEFDNWIYADDTEIGDYTLTPISTVTDATASPEDISYIVAYYEDDGIPSWKVYVKSAIFYEKYEEFYKSLEGDYEVKVREGALKRAI